MAKAMGVGVDAVTEWFTTNADTTAPYYSVWQGKNLVFSSKEDDFERAIQLLEDNLKACEQNQYDEILTIKLNHITKQFKSQIITDKTPVIATYTFRVVPLQSGGYIQPYYGNNSHLATGGEPVYGRSTQAILDKLNGIESRITAIEDEEDIEDENIAGIEPTQPLNFYGILNNLLQKPEVQNRLIGMLGGVLNKLMPTSTPQVNVAGIPNYNEMTEEEKLVQSINILKQVRPQIIDDLVGLANIAQTDPNKLSWILSMMPK